MQLKDLSTATTAMPPRPLARERAGVNLVDALFKGGVLIMALAILGLFIHMNYDLIRVAWPSIKQFGWRFIVSGNWDPVAGDFGALPFIYGTLVSSLLAIVIALPLSLGVAVFLVELAPAWLRQPVSTLIELLAAIPSVVLGLWGIFVFAPWLRDHVQPWLGERLGFLPLFSGPPLGIGMMAAGLILAIMILPIISAVAREVLRAVPQTQREAMLALGATRLEMIRYAVLPYGRAGLLGAVILGLGRALGETMAATMVIGNVPQVSASLFAPGYTMAAVIANEFTEAADALHMEALIEVALVLFGIAVAVNVLARLLVWRVVLKTGVEVIRE